MTSAPIQPMAEHENAVQTKEQIGPLQKTQPEKVCVAGHPSLPQMQPAGRQQKRFM